MRSKSVQPRGRRVSKAKGSVPEQNWHPLPGDGHQDEPVPAAVNQHGGNKGRRNPVAEATRTANHQGALVGVLAAVAGSERQSRVPGSPTRATPVLHKTATRKSVASGAGNHPVAGVAL